MCQDEDAVVIYPFTNSCKALANIGFRMNINHGIFLFWDGQYAITLFTQ